MSAIAATAERTAVLAFIHGSRTGEEIPLDAAGYRIGSSAACDIPLTGAGVEGIHAEFERQGAADWQILDRSRIGILVNGRKVERSPLFDGDRVQIGNEHLLEFRLGAARTTQQQRKSKTPENSRKRGLLQSPWFYGAVGLFYVAFFAGLYLIVSDSGKQADAELTAERASELLCLSRQYLTHLGSTDRGATLPAARHLADTRDAETTSAPCDDALRQAALGPAPGAATPGYCDDMRSSLYALRGSLPESERAVLIGRLLAGLYRDLGDAWMLEAQGRSPEAEETYGKIIECFSDVALPATGFALARRTALRRAH
ncbi:MAG: FHA domain-containing protein [Gammaproteobacteria bacterium]|nr:FHA domain-containing protein [Gammaproteobacteria bacterium]